MNNKFQKNINTSQFVKAIVSTSGLPSKFSTVVLSHLIFPYICVSVVSLKKYVFTSFP